VVDRKRLLSALVHRDSSGGDGVRDVACNVVWRAVLIGTRAVHPRDGGFLHLGGKPLMSFSAPIVRTEPLRSAGRTAQGLMAPTTEKLPKCGS
jgi:hypothetical protein